jgi:hypothetical protein
MFRHEERVSSAAKIRVPATNRLMGGMLALLRVWVNRARQGYRPARTCSMAAVRTWRLLPLTT